MVFHKIYRAVLLFVAPLAGSAANLICVLNGDVFAAGAIVEPTAVAVFVESFACGTGADIYFIAGRRFYRLALRWQ